MLTDYSFSGNGTGNLTGSTFNYSGRVENGQLTVNLTNIKMVNSAQMANTYALSDIIYGRGKDMIRNSDTGLYEWGESDGKMIAAPLYVDMDIELSSDGSFLYAVMTGLVKGMGGYLLAQLLDNVTLQPNGYITANYTTDEMMLGEQKFSEINMEDPESMNKVATFVMYKLFLPYPMGGFQQQDIINATEGVNRNLCSISQRNWPLLVYEERSFLSETGSSGNYHSSHEIAGEKYRSESDGFIDRRYPEFRSGSTQEYIKYYQRSTG